MSASDRLAIKSDLNEACLTADDDVLFGIYQDWVHQNPGTHLDGGLEDNVKWQVIWEKLVCLTTQHYDVPSGQVKKIFVSTLAAYFDGIRDWKWNADWAINFQTVILQRIHLVTGTKNILAQIITRITLWNIGELDKVLNNFYATDTGYLGIPNRNKNVEHCHCAYLNIFLRRKLCEAVIFFCEQ